MKWIDRPTDALCLSDWLTTPAVAVDTEFMREKTYYAELALVQLGRPGEVLLLDAPALGRAPQLLALLGAGALKVMHSASEDLQAMQHAYGCLPAPLFDTQIAAGLCGLDPSTSYQKLVAELCQVSLEKGETRSDWLRRPLSDAQLHYAADDVRYLLQAFEQLRDRLLASGRLPWLEEDCAKSLEAAIEVDEPHPHLALRPAQGLPADAQMRLCRLLRWRDAQARSGNRPRNWVLDAGLALDLVTRLPSSRNEFESVLDRNPKSPRRHRDELFDLLMSEASAAERDIPISQLPDPSEREQIKILQRAVAEVAAELGVQDVVLASRRHLETLLREGRWSTHLSGWRRQLLEARLTPKLPAQIRKSAEHG